MAISCFKYSSPLPISWKLKLHFFHDTEFMYAKKRLPVQRCKSPWPEMLENFKEKCTFLFICTGHNFLSSRNFRENFLKSRNFRENFLKSGNFLKTCIPACITSSLDTQYWISLNHHPAMAQEGLHVLACNSIHLPRPHPLHSLIPTCLSL